MRHLLTLEKKNFSLFLVGILKLGRMISLVLASVLSVSALENPDTSFPSLQGSTGLLRTFSARPNTPHTFATGLMGSFMTEEPFIDDNKHSRTMLRLHANYTFDIGSPLEVFTGFAFSFNENATSAQARTVTTYFENTDLGLRWGRPMIKDKWFLGLQTYARFFSGTQSFRNASGSSATQAGPYVSGELALGSTLDFTSGKRDFPFRHHVNLGYRLPNSNLVSGNEDFRKFSLDAYKYQALTFSTSLEAHYRYVKPFAEFWTEYALMASRAEFGDNRKKITAGTRITPIEVVSLLLAADVNFGGPAADAALGIPRNPDWELWFAVSFSADSRTMGVTKGGVRGSVLDEETGLPLDGVQVGIASSSVSPLVTDISGFYEFNRLPAGEYSIVFNRTGYEPLTRKIIISDGKEQLLDAPLSRIGPRYGALSGSVIDAETQAPIARALISSSAMTSTIASDDLGLFQAPQVIEGSQSIRIEAEGYEPGVFPISIERRKTTTQAFSLNRAAPLKGICSGAVLNEQGTALTAVITYEGQVGGPVGSHPLTGNFEIELPAGRQQIKVQAENYLPQMVDCDVQPGQRTSVDIRLQKPKEATLVENKIVLPDAIYFEFGSARIQRNSFGVLNQVAKLLIDNDANFSKLRVEGHTDSVGSEAFNQRLSEQRAESVRAYLIEQGVAGEKIEALGFGESDPIATNTTDEGRSENRRVEFNLEGVNP
jgi:outer membrane protein OmpA-like peptidoglycan-associated protein